MPQVNISDIVHALKAKTPPTEITQRAFEHSPKTFSRLCNSEVTQLHAADLQDYMDDLRYADVQVELFRHMLPKCLELWKRNLLCSDSCAAGKAIEETFFPALHTKNNMRNALSEPEVELVRKFVAQAILELIDSQQRFSVEDVRATYKIFGHISAYAVVFSKLEQLWNQWWDLSTLGRVISVIRYISVLMYRDDENPLFVPWTRERGGGPPILSETRCDFHHGHWQEENIEFVLEFLTIERLREKLVCASENAIPDDCLYVLSKRLVFEFEHQLPTIHSRLNDLARLICDLSELFWTDSEASG